jgi:hypothetical protein
VTVFERWEALSATEATVETPTTTSRKQGAEIPDERLASIGHRHGAARGTPWIEEEEKKELIEESDRFSTGADVSRREC